MHRRRRALIVLAAGFLVVIGIGWLAVRYSSLRDGAATSDPASIDTRSPGTPPTGPTEATPPTMTVTVTTPVPVGNEPPDPGDPDPVVPPSTPLGSPTANPNSPPATQPAEAALAAFERDCEQNLATGAWQIANVIYPRTMTLEVGSAESYNAAVKLGVDPGAPLKQLIAATDPTSEPVLVQCLISAKLEAVGDDIDVEATGNFAESDGWYLQTFTPGGTVEWIWTVTARTPGAGDLRLVLRPAVAIQGLRTGPATGQQVYLTEVTVTASTMNRISYWFDTEFPTIGKVAAAIGAAILAVLGWLALFGEKWGALRPRGRQRPGTADNADTAHSGRHHADPTEATSSGSQRQA